MLETCIFTSRITKAPYYFKFESNDEPLRSMKRSGTEFVLIKCPCILKAFFKFRTFTIVIRDYNDTRNIIHERNDFTRAVYSNY